MAFRYDENPDKLVEQVRILIGDTNDSRELLQDTEIQFFIDQEGGLYAAAASAARAIAAKFAGDVAVNRASGSLSKDQRFAHYMKLAQSLELKGIGRAESFAGGREISEKDRQQTKRDRVQSRFRRDMDTIDQQTADEFEDKF
jgi:hypothetical protein